MPDFLGCGVLGAHDGALAGSEQLPGKRTGRLTPEGHWKGPRHCRVTRASCFLPLSEPFARFVGKESTPYRLKEGVCTHWGSLTFLQSKLVKRKADPVVQVSAPRPRVNSGCREAKDPSADSSPLTSICLSIC